MARISYGPACPLCMRCATRWVSTLVLPEPAPARTRRGPPSWNTASACGPFSPSPTRATPAAPGPTTETALGARVAVGAAEGSGETGLRSGSVTSQWYRTQRPATSNGAPDARPGVARRMRDPRGATRGGRSDARPLGVPGQVAELLVENLALLEFALLMRRTDLLEFVLHLHHTPHDALHRLRHGVGQVRVVD